MSNFYDLTQVVMVVKVKSKALFIGSYSNSQQRLFDRVFLLREKEQLTFEAIAKLLCKSGTRSVNGCLLGAEHVFSIYKKGKIRQERIALKVKPELVDLCVDADRKLTAQRRECRSKIDRGVQLYC